MYKHKTTLTDDFCLQRELEVLRQQDQQRMQALQRTLTELQKEEQELAAQRVHGHTRADGTEQKDQQVHKEFPTRVKLNEEMSEKTRLPLVIFQALRPPVVRIFFTTDAIAQTHGKVAEGEFRPDRAAVVTESGKSHP